MIDTVHQQLVADGLSEARQRLMEAKKNRKWSKARGTLDEIGDILLNLVSLNKITPKPLDIKHYSLPKLLTSIHQMYRPFFRKQGIAFRIQAAPHLQVAVDDTTFFRIFFNIIYYMGQHIDVEVKENHFIQVEAKRYDDHLVAIYIEDNGKYPVGVYQTIFDQSYDQRVVNTIGGIGLEAVKEWMTALQGSIQLVDKLSQGIKCCLLLPSKKNELPRKRVQANAPNLLENEVNKQLTKVPKDHYLR